MRRIISGMTAFTAMTYAATIALANNSVDDYFRTYYRRLVLGAPYHGPLGFLQEAAAAHSDVEKMLKAGASRTVVPTATCRSRTARTLTRSWPWPSTERPTALPPPHRRQLRLR